MLEVRRLSTVLLASALVAGSACGPADQVEAEAEMAEAEVAQSASTQELTCFLRGASLEEAAERSSPLGQLTLTFGDQSAKLCYGRPSARERIVMGELVPLGSPWRMGANEATGLHLPFAAEVGGVDLEPGSYSLYAVPGETEWEIVINGNAERWGIPINDEVMAQNVGSITRPVSVTESTVETLTYTWESHGEGMGHIVLEWENTRVEIPVHGPGMM
jgi:hypothetical protein